MIGVNTFEIPLTLHKAWSGPAGKMRIGGIASDECVDLDHEVTAANGLLDSIDYLKSWGKFNDNHGNTLIGEVDEAEVTTKGRLVQKGFFTEQEIAPEQWGENCLWVAGFLYSRVPEARRYWEIMKSGGRIGLSLQGRILKRSVLHKGGKRVLVNSKCFVNQIAVTGEPKNPNAVAKMLKSLRPIGPCAACVSCATGGGDCLKKAIEEARRHEVTLRKALSVEEKRQMVQTAIGLPAHLPYQVSPESAWITDMYDECAIVDCRGKLYKVPYTIAEGEAKLGEWTEVKRRVDYRPLKKALATGAGIVGAGEGGGESLRKQSIEGKPKKAAKKGVSWDQKRADGQEDEMEKSVHALLSSLEARPFRPTSTAGRLKMLSGIYQGDHPDEFSDEVRVAAAERLLKSLRDERFGWEDDVLGKSLVTPSGLTDGDIAIVERIHGLTDEEIGKMGGSVVLEKARSCKPKKLRKLRAKLAKEDKIDAPDEFASNIMRRKYGKQWYAKLQSQEKSLGVSDAEMDFAEVELLSKAETGERLAEDDLALATALAGRGMGRNGGPYAAGPGGNCRCTKCGKEVPHEAGVPCTDTACPECGAGMIRADE